ncbi:MAG TPA: hypothetical protein VIG69_12765 [Candidatus Methylomirabilis sp.]
MRGRIRFGLILGLVIGAVGIYAGSQAAYHYWTYWNLWEEAERGAVEVAARGTEAQARQMVQAKGREYGLDFADEEISVKVQGAVVTVSLAWERPVELPWYTYTLRFKVNATSSRGR